MSATAPRVPPRQRVIKALWHGVDPFWGFPPKLFVTDASGWNSDHPFLSLEIDRLRPDLVVEVGVWKGGSTLTMANRMRAIGHDGVVIAVDTWLGSAEHWMDSKQLAELSPQNGYPQLFYKFMNNVLAADLWRHVVPLPIDSVNAAIVLAAKQLQPTLIHIDASHDYPSVTGDLDRWWALLQPGGVMIVDDYDQTRQVWPSVGQAVDDFLARTAHHDFLAQPYKCRFTKPVQPAPPADQTPQGTKGMPRWSAANTAS
ncbi:MAG: class I SAM-dependent methyltransferase [Acetobacteraceae bacterium]